MISKATISKVNCNYSRYLKEAKRPYKGNPTYICLCGNGTGPDGTGLIMLDKPDNPHFKCFVCGFYGDLIEYYSQEHHCGFREAVKDLCKILNIEQP